MGTWIKPFAYRQIEGILRWRHAIVRPWGRGQPAISEGKSNGMTAIFAEIGGYIIFVRIILGNNNTLTESLKKNAENGYYRNNLFQIETILVAKLRGHGDIT